MKPNSEVTFTQIVSVKVPELLSITGENVAELYTPFMSSSIDRHLQCRYKCSRKKSWTKP